jgi:hypothetical protein
MTDFSADILSDEELLEMAFPLPAKNGSDIPELENFAQLDLLNSIDTQTGAPAGIRAQVAAAQTEEDRLATVRKFYPKALPVEVLDPDYGASRFGRGNFVFNNPETGRLTLFDEDMRIFGMPIPTLADFADAGPEIAETIGAIGGGFAGAAAGAGAGTLALPGVGTVAGGTAGFVAGEGLGSAAAREAYINVMRFFGETEDNRVMSERIADFSVTAGMNAAAGPILSGIFKGAKIVVGAPIRYSMRAKNMSAEKKLQQMKDLGISNPSAPSISNNPMLAMFSQYLHATPASSAIMMRNSAQTLKELDAATTELAGKYGGVRSTSEAAKSVMTSAQAARVRYEEQLKTMYDEIDELIPDTVISEGANTQEFIKKYIANAETATGKPTMHPALAQAQMLMTDVSNGRLNYNTLKEFKSSLQRNTRSAEAKGAFALSGADAKSKELIGYVTADMHDLVASAGEQIAKEIGGKAGEVAKANLLKKYKATNAFVNKSMSAGGDIKFIDKVIRTGGDEATAALLYATNPASLKMGAERMEKLRRQFTPEEFDVLAGYMLGKMGMQKGTTAGVGQIAEEGFERTGADAIADAGWSTGEFLKNYNNLSAETKKALFGGTKYRELTPALNNLTTVIEDVHKAAGAMANPSGTARLLGAVSAFSPSIGVLSGVFDGDAFKYGLSSLIAPYAQAQVFTQPAFVNWLAKGIELKAYNPKAFPQHIRRLAVIGIANPWIRDQIRGIIQGLSHEPLEPMPWENSSSKRGFNAIPENNEVGFRQVVPKSTADKLLPNREEMMATLNNMTIPQVGSALESIFEPLPSTGIQAPGSFQAGLSPIVLPNDADRELALRMQANSGGIAALG